MVITNNKSIVVKQISAMNDYYCYVSQVIETASLYFHGNIIKPRVALEILLSDVADTLIHPNVFISK